MLMLDCRHLVGTFLAAVLLLVCWKGALAQQAPAALYAVQDDRMVQSPHSHFEAMSYKSPHVYLAKRSTIILDKLMYALQKALHKDPSLENETELRQRTGPGGKVYWRCYFNAVSCFRRRRR